MESEATKVAADLARPFEGLFLRPYLCPAGVPSIGYGATHYETGLRVSLTDPPITKERAEQLLQWEMRKCYSAVLRMCVMYDWSPSAIGAIMDFCFNLGVSRLAASTLRLRLLDGDIAGAQKELMKWVHAAGKTLPGLVRRRAAEAEKLGE